MNQLVPMSSPPLPAIVAASERADGRFLEYFAANILNPHTRRTYAAPPMNSSLGARSPTCRRSAASIRSTSPPGSRSGRDLASIAFRPCSTKISTKSNRPLILEPGPAALTDALAELQKIIGHWATRH
jgi:hypothetical protein